MESEESGEEQILHPIFPLHNHLLTVKLNFSPAHHFSNSLFFEAWRWKNNFFLSEGLAKNDNTTLYDTHITVHNTQQPFSPPV